MCTLQFTLHFILDAAKPRVNRAMYGNFKTCQAAVVPQLYEAERRGVKKMKTSLQTATLIRSGKIYILMCNFIKAYPVPVAVIFQEDELEGPDLVISRTFVILSGRR